MAISYTNSVSSILTASPMILSSDNTSDPFERVTKYGDGSWYNEYHDENYFFVSDTKDITTNSGQINLTQE